MVDVLRDRYLEPPESEEIGYCSLCGYEIYRGEPYYETKDGKLYCDECCVRGG